MSSTARAITLLLSLGVGAVLMSAAPAYGNSLPNCRTEVRVEKPAVGLKRIRYTAPRYPEKAVQARLSGFVTIEFVVNEKGEPTRLRVVDARHAEVFARSVLTAAKRWRYRPLLANNAPVGTPTRTIVRFETNT